MGLVILLLTSKRGVSKTLAYLLSQALAFIIWGVAILELSISFSGLRDSNPSDTSLTIRAFVGLLLMNIAVRVFLNDHDPDGLPPKWQSLIERVSPIGLFFLNLFLSLLQIRYVLLIMIGTDMIKTAKLSQMGTTLGLLILVFALLLPQILPLIVFVALRDKRDQALAAMNNWLSKNSRLINSGLMGLVGIYLVASSLLQLVR